MVPSGFAQVLVGASGSLVPGSPVVHARTRPWMLLEDADWHQERWNTENGTVGAAGVLSVTGLVCAAMRLRVVHFLRADGAVLLAATWQRYTAH